MPEHPGASACKKAFLTSWRTGEVPPLDTTAQIENLSRGSFAFGEIAESCGFCASGHPLQFPPVLLCGTNENCEEAIFSGKWDFSMQKSSRSRRTRGGFADFPNRQNRSDLADLKTLWDFQPAAGYDESAKGSPSSRSLLFFDSLKRRSAPTLFCYSSYF